MINPLGPLVFAILLAVVLAAGEAGAEESPCGPLKARACLLAGREEEAGGDEDRAAARYEAACALGEREACREQREQAALRDPRPVQADGLRFGWYAPAEATAVACAAGHALACVTLALWTEKGIEGRQGPGRAVRLYEKACEGGETQGCDGLRGMLAKDTVPSSRREALRGKFRDLCGLTGKPCAAEFRERGAALLIHNTSAAAWLFAQACEASEARACVDLASIVDAGGSWVPEPRRVTLLARACSLGAPEACPGYWSRILAKKEEQSGRKASFLGDGKSSTFMTLGFAWALPVHRSVAAYGTELTVSHLPGWEPRKSTTMLPLAVGGFLRLLLDADRGHLSGGGQVGFGPLGVELGYSSISKTRTLAAEHGVLVGPFLSLGFFSTSLAWVIGTGSTKNAVSAVLAFKIPFGLAGSSALDFVPILAVH